MENLLKNLEELREKIISAKSLLDIAALETEGRALKRKMSDPDFWLDQKKAVEISKRVENLESEVRDWHSLEDEIIELEKLVAMGNRENDNSIYKDAVKSFESLVKKFTVLEFMLLFSGKYDSRGAILSIHAGAGGVDAQDWAQMLSRMVIRFCERKGWSVEIIENTPGQEAGIKRMVLKIDGHWAYGYLRSENGVHRLVRISPFDAEAMRHTSFAKIEVIPELPEETEIELKDEDLRVDVYRSSGPGGQSVNTTDSAVRIVHIPTKISVASQTERSQHQNREIAMKLLKSKLFQLEEEKKQAEEAKLKGKVQKAEWGKQIRSYVLQPYRMVKDHRTGYSTDQVNDILDGGLEVFIESYLKWSREKK